MVLAAVTFVAAACEKNNPEQNDQQSTEQPGDSSDPTVNPSDNPSVDPSTPMTPAQIKQRLEEIGLEVLSYGDMENWKWGMESFALMGNLMTGDTPDGEEEIDNGVFEEIGAEVVTEITDADGWYNRDITIHLSQIEGLYSFDEKDLYWSQEDGNGLVFDAPYKDTHLVLSCNVEDYPDELFLASYEHYSNSWWNEYRYLETDWNATEERWESLGAQDELYYFYDPKTGEQYGPMEDIWEEREIKERFEELRMERLNATVYMPRKIAATLVRDGKDVLTIDADVEYEDSNANKALDPGEDRIAVVSHFTFDKYDFKVKRADYYTGNGSVECVLSCSDTPLMTVTANVEGVSIERNVYDESGEDIEETEPGTLPNWGYIFHRTGNVFDGPSEPTGADVDIDILGKLQVKGACDVVNLMKNLKKADDSQSSEATFKSFVTQAEQCFNLDVYFDGATTAQATLGLEPDKSTHDGRTYLDVIPVIRFADGTSYAVFESFFDPEDFKNLVSAAQNWADAVGEYLNKLGIFRKEEARPIDPYDPEESSDPAYPEDPATK